LERGMVSDLNFPVNMNIVIVQQSRLLLFYPKIVNVIMGLCSAV